MSSSPQRSRPSTYFVPDRSSQDEVKRLQIQARMIIASIGGVLPEQPDPTSFQRVLDVGCGTGCWIIEMAKTYPSLDHLVGVDINSQMIDYACTQAKAEQVSERVKFRVMDALHMLAFLSDSFDLVNQHFALSWVRTWDWPKLLAEYQRVVRPGGVVRITEGDWTGETSSPALAQISYIWQEAFYQAGHRFTPDSDGAMGELPSLLARHGLENVQSRAFALEYRAGTQEGQDFYKDMELGIRAIQPFLRRWVRLPENYEKICQQALSEMQQPDFVVKGQLMTVWGTVPLEV